MALFSQTILIGLALSLSREDITVGRHSAPRTSADSHDAAIEGVAMRFQDEVAFVSGVTYTR